MRKYDNSPGFIAVIFGTNLLNNFYPGVKQIRFLIDWQRDSLSLFIIFNCMAIFYNIRLALIKCFLLSERNILYFSDHENQGTFPYSKISFKTEAIPVNNFIFNTWLFSINLFPDYFYQRHSKYLL